MASTQTPTTGTRFVALDAVRGIAAACVVLAHITATNAAVAAKGTPTSWPRWLTVLTPVHLLWDGPIAVTVFFVLSGFVLSLPFLRHPARDAAARVRWAAFYPKRLVRLYLPAWGALVVAYGIMLLVARRPTTHGSAWLAHNSHHPTLHALGHGAVLVTGAGSLDGPLWSLGLEVVYSMLLPAVVLLCVLRWLPEWAKWLAAIVSVTLAGAAASRSAALLCAFVFGALLASAHVRRPTPPPWLTAPAFVVLALASLVGLNAGPVVGLAHLPHHLSGGITRCLTILGATGVVFVVVFWSAAARALSVRPLEWLGTRSFSLYLIHFPVVIALSHLIDPAHLAVLIIIELAASLLAAELFCRAIERPSHELSKRVGRWAADRVIARSAAQPSSGSER